MVVKLSPELEARLQKLSAATGRAPDDLVEDAMAGYLAELAQTRNTLDSRYDELKSGRALPVDGEDVILHFRKKGQVHREFPQTKRRVIPNPAAFPGG